MDDGYHVAVYIRSELKGQLNIAVPVELLSSVTAVPTKDRALKLKIHLV